MIYSINPSTTPKVTASPVLFMPPSLRMKWATNPPTSSAMPEAAAGGDFNVFLDLKFQCFWIYMVLDFNVLGFQFAVDRNTTRDCK
jgi:hypothetical protein